MKRTDIKESDRKIMDLLSKRIEELKLAISDERRDVKKTLLISTLRMNQYILNGIQQKYE